MTQQVPIVAPALAHMTPTDPTVETGGSWLPIGASEAGDGPLLTEGISVTMTDPGIPQSIGELDALVSTIYDLTATKAGELKIPVAGSIGGGVSRRVVVAEYAQTKLIAGSDGIERRYGYAIRFCLTVSKWDANAKLSLPFLSAQAELGQVEAGWTMQVIGLGGPKIQAAVLPPKPLTVETFVIAQQALEKIIAAIVDPTTQFKPGVVVAVNDPTAAPAKLRKAVVQAFALYRLFKGDSANRAIADLGSISGADSDNILEAYREIGVASANDVPTPGDRSAAQGILAGVKISN